MPKFTPTDQQMAIDEAVLTGNTVVVKALAGTGKTSTLRLIAQRRPQVNMTAIMFNRSVADEGQRTFPRNVTVNTAHSFAKRRMMQERPELLERLSNQGRIPAWMAADILRIPSQFSFEGFRLRDKQLASLVMEAVKRFCGSTATEPQAWMVPRVNGLDTPEAKAALAEFLLPFVRRAWSDLISDRGRLRFTHDVYLKLFSMLDDCILPGDVILFDEAQDADPVILHIVERQRMRGAQIVAVGDDYQQIYDWRGAVNSLAKFDTDLVLPLTQSFRFGPAIAAEANRILSLLPGDLEVQGFEGIDSKLAILDDPHTVLCRTNAESIARLMTAQVAGVRAGIVGGTQQVEYLAQAAKDLIEGRLTSHPELQAFTTWGQVQEYAEEDKDARDLQVLVRLVDRHGPDVLLEAVGQASPEQGAHLLLSTMHKAKGREWDSVLLANDFPPPITAEGKLADSELRLAYVAATRAKKYLDSSALSWIELLPPHLKGDQPREFLPADQVPSREATKAIEVAQVMIDPLSEHRVIMQGTKYDPALVEAQKGLPTDARPSYRGEYEGFQRVRIVNASYRVLQVAEKFGLTISPSARERIDNYS